MDKKDIIMLIIGQLNKHAWIKEVLSGGGPTLTFFFVLFFVFLD